MILPNSYIGNLLFSVAFLYFSSCTTTNPDKIATKASAGTTGSASPQSCLITGLVVLTEKALETRDNSAVCGHAPCYARIQILDVENCGQTITFPFIERDTIPAFFTCSLSPVYKKVDPHQLVLPGLKAGDRFQAYVEQRIQPGNQVVYRINTYLKLKN